VVEHGESQAVSPERGHPGGNRWYEDEVRGSEGREKSHRGHAGVSIRDVRIGTGAVSEGDLRRAIAHATGRLRNRSLGFSPGTNNKTP
jgi:hypothetical protein